MVATLAYTYVYTCKIYVCNTAMAATFARRLAVGASDTYIFIYMYIYLHVYLYIHIYVCIYIYIHIGIYIYI